MRQADSGGDRFAFAVAVADERPRPTVKRLCPRCRPKLYLVDAAANRVVVSSRGTAHWGESGDTACGLDATGGGWWWPL